MNLKAIDRNENADDLINEIKVQLVKNPLDKGLLIRECFLLWYILVEGINCESFDEESIEALLKTNYETYQMHYANDTDYNFIIGWALNVAFWYFGVGLDEEDGNKLLMNAYKNKRDNSLFQWAVRDELRLDKNNIEKLNNDIRSDFFRWYPYDSFIREYFLDLI